MSTNTTTERMNRVSVSRLGTLTICDETATRETLRVGEEERFNLNLTHVVRPVYP